MYRLCPNTNPRFPSLNPPGAHTGFLHCPAVDVQPVNSTRADVSSSPVKVDVWDAGLLRLRVKRDLSAKVETRLNVVEVTIGHRYFSPSSSRIAAE